MEIIREISVKGPFCLRSVIPVIRRNDQHNMFTSSENRLNLSFEVPGGAVTAWLNQEETNGNLIVQFLGDLVDDENADYLINNISRMFALDIDPTEFYSIFRNDDNIRSIKNRFLDYRPIRYFTPFEAAINILIQKNNTSYQASSIISNLHEVAGIVPQGVADAPPAFPGKFTLLAMPVKLLEITGLSTYKIGLIRDFCSYLAGEEDVLESLLTKTNWPESRRILQSLPGIDKRSANYLLLKGYSHNDILFDDSSLIKAVKNCYKLSELPDIITLSYLAEPYIPWRSWWTDLILTINSYQTQT